MKRCRNIVISMVVLLMSLSVTGLAFDDIHSPELARQVDTLQMMGIVNGVSNTKFDPDATLTRAQFTKMAVVAMGKKDEAKRQADTTIFPDVRSKHWAVGYINLAVRGEEKFMSGFSNGTFGPDRTITYGEAVTILMRLLGYSDADVGMMWPLGYIKEGDSIGLTDDVHLQGSQTISRAQAVTLFVNLLTTEKKDSTKTFAESVSAESQRDVILINADVEGEDAEKAIETSMGVHALAHAHSPHLIQGMRGTLLLDRKGDALGFVPNSSNRVKDITVSCATAGEITATTGREYTVKASVTAYYKGEEEKYGDMFMHLNAGTKVSLHLDLADRVTCVFVAENTTKTAIVVTKDRSEQGFSHLADGRNDYSILRNGEIISPSQLRVFDVASYVSADNQIVISTLRLTGNYDKAYPNAGAPSKVTLLGTEFDVLPDAIGNFTGYHLDEQITLLLTKDHKVAGVVSAKQLRADSVGLASVDGNTATVQLEEGLTVKGKVDDKASRFDGELVKVSSTENDELRLSSVKETNSTYPLYVKERKLGEKSLADDVRVYERVDKGAVAQISLEDIDANKVLSNQVEYIRYNDSGAVDILVLDNVTGERFIYGIASFEKVKITETFLDKDKDPKTVEKLQLMIDSNGTKYGPYLGGGVSAGEYVGIAPNKYGTSIMTYAKLDAIRVDYTAWIDKDTVAINNKQYSVSDDVICYNETSRIWVELSTARAFEGKMTLYVDEHNVIRMIAIRE